MILNIASSLTGEQNTSWMFCIGNILANPEGTKSPSSYHQPTHHFMQTQKSEKFYKFEQI